MNPRVTKVMDEIIMTCLSESPGDRPGSMDEILADLHVEFRESLLTSG
jgi:hypothetical protein